MATGDLPSHRDAEPRATLVLYHRRGAIAVPLEPDLPVVIGRGSDADVTVADASLSRAHARIVWTDDGIVIEDLDSRNGVRVEGRAVERAVLRPGDEIRIGATSAALQLMGPERTDRLWVESYDRFVARLEEEVVRAHTFRRGFTLFLVAAGGAAGDLAHGSASGAVAGWLAPLRRALRPVDRLGAYGPRSVLVLAPELERTEAEQRAATLIDAGQEKNLQLQVGLATYPSAGTSVDKLVEAAREAARSAQPGTPAVAPSSDRSERHDAPTIAQSGSLQTVLANAKRLAAGTIPVLIVGETGVGKEVVARAIHEHGPRASGPFVAINCGAIPSSLLESTLFGHVKGAFTGAVEASDGVFHQASGGTVLLDEIGELPLHAQSALLRVLETKQVKRIGANREETVDVRILSATHRDLGEMCEEASFREDLLYRLNAVTLVVPPLRERPDDILPLAEVFLEQARRLGDSPAHRIGDEAAELLVAHPWPGNVRQLRNVVERAVLLAQGEEVQPVDLSDRFRGEALGAGGLAPSPDASDEEVSFKARVRRFESRLITEALRASGGNQTAAAKRLRIPLRTLVRKIREYGLR
jgi:DNA-binding NtrC family response regulator